MRRRNQEGAATAETAVALPVLVLLAVALAWLVALGVSQVQVVDAAREVARAVARGDDEGNGLALGRRIAPDGARIRVSRGGGRVVVEVSAQVRGPGGVFGFLPGFPAHARAEAAQEPGS